MLTSSLLSRIAVTFSEITQRAVQNALAEPRQINLPLVRAQQARQAVDYLVGFTLSPVLWRKLPGCRSAGRVQSVALRIIVEREHAIARFEPQEHWKVKTKLTPADAPAGGDASGPSLLAELTHLDGERLRQFDLGSAEQTEAALNSLPQAWRVQKVRRSQRQIGPPAPYNTASLQQDASRRLGMGVGRVMRIAQSLYEGMPLGGGENVALITYMRTDGIEMSAEGVAAARSYIASAYGEGGEWLPESPRQFKRKKRNAQEAHEAVRPVAMDITPDSLRGKIGVAELRLYELIWRRAIASQMANAVHEQLAITLQPADGVDRGTGAQARASGSRLLSPGYKALTNLPRIPREETETEEETEEEEEEEGDGAGTADAGAAEEGNEADSLNPLLESLAEGDVLQPAEVLPSQHFTEPPPRFSEGSLVSHLEELGIGRPSTYASIMRSLQERGYCAMVSKRLLPKQRGELVTALLTSEQLEQYVQTDFTARLEQQLDAISAGEGDYSSFLTSWWGEFREAVSAIEGTDTLALREEVADKCAWSLFPSTGLVRPPASLVPARGSDPSVAAQDGTQPPSPTVRVADAPELQSVESGAEPANNIITAKPARPDRPCPSCGVGQMVLKFSRFGPFVGCSEYPSCGWTTRPREPGMGAGEDSPVDKLSLGLLGQGALPPSESGMEYSGLEVSVRDGPVGWYVQLGGNVTHELMKLTPPPDVRALKITQLREELEKRGISPKGRKPELQLRLLQAEDLRHLVPHKRVSLPAGVKPAELTMLQAERLLSLPKLLGGHPRRGDLPITLHQGRFGPYVTMGSAEEEEDDDNEAAAAAGDAGEAEEATPALVMCSLPKRVSIWDIDAEVAADLIDGKIRRDAARRKSGSSRAGGRAAGSKAASRKAKKPAAARKSPAKKAAAKKADEPKRPLNAYMLYTGEHRALFKEAHPDAGIGELSKLMGEKWKAMSDAEKSPYTSKADELKAQFLASVK